VDGFPVSSTNKTDRHDVAEILLKMALSTISLQHWIKRSILSKLKNSIIIYGLSCAELIEYVLFVWTFMLSDHLQVL
jgi:hypothetical protein